MSAPLSPRPLLLGVLLLVGVGCRFEEPEPSEAIYMAAVASVEPRPARLAPTPAPSAPAGGRDVAPILARALEHAGSERGFLVDTAETRVAFRPPGDLLRVDRLGRETVVALWGQASECRVRRGRVVHRCGPAERRRALLEARAARIVHLHGLDADPSLSLATDGTGVLQVSGGDLGTMTARFAADTGALVAIESRGQPLLIRVLRAERRPLPEGDLWSSAVAQVPDGVREVVDARAVHGICAMHRGPLLQLGPVIRQLTDWTDQNKSLVDDRAGVLAEESGNGAWRICLVLRAAANGSIPLQARREARLWHRGSYGALEARRGELEAWIRAEGQAVDRTRGGLRVRLFFDPETTPAAERVSRLSLPLRAIE